MNEDTPHLTETKSTGRNRFPIVAQLGVLALVLIGLFGSLLLPSHKDQAAPVASEAVAPIKKPTPVVPQKIKNVPLRATAAYVWDVRSQRALYSKNANEPLPLASITKLMTTLLAYELVDDNTDTAVPLSAIQQEGNSGLSEGERFTTEELRELALISSSNDAAYALAASVGTLLGDQDPTSQFIAGMNIRAKELGLSSLHFKSTTGLDLSKTEPGAVGSARDISFLMEYIITHHPEIIAPTKQKNTLVYNESGEYHEAENTNHIVSEIPNLIGSKTGYTDLAGGNLTIAFDAGFDRPIIVTVLGSTYEGRFNDVLTLTQAVEATLGQSPTK